MKLGLVLCLLVFGAVLPSLARDSAADESMLIALENAWNQAQLHRDGKALNALVADTFVYTDYDGTVMNKPQFMSDLKDPAYRASMVANEDVRVIRYENLAIVIGTYHTKGTYKTTPFDHRGRFTDTWIFQSGKWQCIASHTSLLTKE